MVSFIIVAKEKKKREAYVQEYAKKHEINSFDITIIEKDAENKTQSIGIETVKLMQKKLFLKPIQSKSKLVIIEDAQLLTPEAQNALLKVLEEPPAHTLIMLGSDTKETLLPTILSRCQLIELEEEQKKLTEKTIAELTTFIESLPDLSIGERLKQAEKLAKDKDKAVEWIENLILILREKLLNKYAAGTLDTLDTFNTPDTLKKFQSLYTLLKTTNVNPRFAIEHTLLSL